MYMYIDVSKTLKLQMSLPIPILLLIIFIVYIIVYISSIFPMRKIKNINIIEAIKGTSKNKINRRETKSPKIIQRLFGIEGEIAYKNIRREKTKYKTIIISITTSLVVFLVISGFIANLYRDSFKGKEYNDYLIQNVKYETLSEVVEYLENRKLMKRIFCNKYGIC